MLAGEITIDGMSIGVIEINLSSEIEVLPDFEGYEPSGRADDGLGGEQGGREHKHGIRHPQSHEHSKHHFPGHEHHPDPGTHHDHEMAPRRDAPAGRTYTGDPGRTFPQGSEQTDAAIRRAAKEAGVDVNTMRGIASIESGMNPSSNANRGTQYKGLYQIGHDEWRRTGQGGNIYSAEDNAMAAARLFRENSRQFENRYGRAPTDTELYLMHQQGLGFYTRGAMTNIGGNPYPGMRGPQTHESFEAGWGRELARRKAAFSRTNAPVVEKPPMPTSTEPM